jgi:hypothetical protein
MTSSSARPSSLQSLSVSSSLSRHLESDEELHEAGASGVVDEHGDAGAQDVADEAKVTEFEQRLMKTLEKKIVGKMDRLVEKGIKAALGSLPAPGTVSVSASGSGAKSGSASARKAKSVNLGVNLGGSLLSSLAKNSGAATFASVTEDLSDSDDNEDEIGGNVGGTQNGLNLPNLKVSAESTPGSNAVRLIAEMNTSERIAPELLAQAQIYGSLSNWVRSVDWNKTRNRNECASLAQAIDILLAEGVDSNSLGLEILLRRVSGVQLADHYGDWNVASALQWSGPNNSLLGRNVLTSTLKQAYQMTKLTSRVGTNSGSGPNKQFKKKPFDKDSNSGKGGWTPNQNAGQQKFGQQGFGNQPQKSHQSNSGAAKAGGTSQQ